MDEEDERLIQEVLKCNKENTNNYLAYLYHRYPILNKYKYLTMDNLDDLNSGDKIVFVNTNNILSFGGIFIKTCGYYPAIRNPLLRTLSEVPSNNEKNITLLLKLDTYFYHIRFDKLYIFYEKKKDKSDVLRNILVKKI
jgi:hypothetical protein